MLQGLTPQPDTRPTHIDVSLPRRECGTIHTSELLSLPQTQAPRPWELLWMPQPLWLMLQPSQAHKATPATCAR